MSSPTAAQFYAQLRGTFERCHRHMAIPDLVFCAGGRRIRVRCTSMMLREQMRRPLAHLQVRDDDIPADFTVDLVDASATDVVMPLLPWPAQNISPEQDTREFQEDGFLFTQHGDVMLTGLNYEAHRTIGFVRDPANWPLNHYKQAIFITLYQHLRGRGLYLVHASAIARNGHALLIAGHSGAGKTTTMLTCVRAGFHFVGDDTTLVERGPDGVIRVISLLSTFNVTNKTVSWFPELEPHLSRLSSPKGKRMVILPEVYPGRMAPEARVSMILVPEVSDRPTTTLASASKVALLSDMLLNSLDLHEAAAAKRHLDFLAELLEAVPSRRILLGQDRERLPELLGQLLDETASVDKPQGHRFIR